MNPEEYSNLPEAKASVVVTLDRLDIHANLLGAPATITTVEGVTFKLPAHLQAVAKRVLASGVPMRGRRGKLPKLLSDIDPPLAVTLAPTPPTLVSLFTSLV